MAVNVEIVKSGNENNLSVIKKFTRKVQASGILPRLRRIRYNSRKMSEYVKKKKTLKTLERRQKVAELIKMGKLPEKFSK